MLGSFKLSSDVTDWVGTWDETDSNVYLSEESQTLYFDFEELFSEEPDKDRSNYSLKYLLMVEIALQLPSI